MKRVLLSLFCLLISVLLANPVFAHGGGGGGGGGAGGGGGGAGAGGGNGGHGLGHGMGPSVSANAGHNSRGHTMSNLSRDSHHLTRDSHRNRLHLGRHHVSGRLAHHSRSLHHTSSTAHFARNATLKGEKKGFVECLPPGQESRLDRGKELSPGWAKKVGSIVTDSDTASDKALSPRQEIQEDRGKVVPDETESRRDRGEERSGDLDRGEERSSEGTKKAGPIVTDSDTASDKALSPGQEIQEDRENVVPVETNP